MLRATTDPPAKPRFAGVGTWVALLLTMNPYTRGSQVTLMGIPRLFPEGAPTMMAPALSVLDRSAEPLLVVEEAARAFLRMSKERVVIAAPVAPPTPRPVMLPAAGRASTGPFAPSPSDLGAEAPWAPFDLAPFAADPPFSGKATVLSASRRSHLGPDTLKIIAPLLVRPLARPFAPARFSVKRALALTLAAIAVVLTSGSVALALT